MGFGSVFLHAVNSPGYGAAQAGGIIFACKFVKRFHNLLLKLRPYVRIIQHINHTEMEGIMDKHELTTLLSDVAAGKVSVDDAALKLKM